MRISDWSSDVCSSDLMPVGVVPGVHPFTVTSHVTVTAMLALISFATVLIVGFARHGLHFFSLFVPHGVPGWMLPIIVPVEFISFMIRPFSLALRLFVAMTAGHILLKVLEIGRASCRERVCQYV